MCIRGMSKRREKKEEILRKCILSRVVDFGQRKWESIHPADAKKIRTYSSSF
jgi:hypothetical protein